MQSFVVPEAVRAAYAVVTVKGEAAKQVWTTTMTSYRTEHPALAASFDGQMAGDLPLDWAACIPSYSAEVTFIFHSYLLYLRHDLRQDSKQVATRNRSEEILNLIAGAVPGLVGGSADLTGSNLTNLKVTTMFPFHVTNFDFPVL